MLTNFPTVSKPGCLLAVFLCAVLSLHSLRAAAEQAASHSSELVNGESENAIPTAPVVIDGIRLFSVRGLPALPAEDRAQRIADRISTLAVDNRFGIQTFKSVEVPAGFW